MKNFGGSLKTDIGMVVMTDNIFFTADEHHSHENIIKYCDRPFKDVNQQTKIIIEKHNDTVNEHSVVYHLGDFFWGGADQAPSFLRILKRYKKVKSRILILGNHDKLNPWTYVDAGFSSVHTSCVIGGNTLLSHDPCVYQAGVWELNMFCGHVHGLWKKLNDRNIINVGVDVWGFAPVSLKTLLEEI